MVIWLSYTHKFENVGKEYRVQFDYEEDGVSLRGIYIWVKFSGKPENLTKAKRYIENFVNVEYTMDYIYRDESNKYETYSPYIEILVNDEFNEMRKDYP
jgi:hypothetical protein